MSWSGFVKGVSRAGTSLMQKAGAMDKTVDKIFDEEEKKYRCLEQRASRLGKDGKSYLDNLRALTVTQQRIAEYLDTFFDDQSSYGNISMSYREALKEIDEKYRPDMDNNFRVTVLEPVNKYIAYFGQINEAIKKRHNKLLDYDSARSRVRKLVDKPSDDPSKLPKAEATANEAKELYEKINRELIIELERFVSLRVEYLQPCFDALASSQINFARDCHFILGRLDNSLQNSHMESAERILEQMKELEILRS